MPYRHLYQEGSLLYHYSEWIEPKIKKPLKANQQEQSPVSKPIDASFKNVCIQITSFDVLPSITLSLAIDSSSPTTPHITPKYSFSEKVERIKHNLTGKPNQSYEHKRPQSQNYRINRECYEKLSEKPSEQIPNDIRKNLDKVQKQRSKDTQAKLELPVKQNFLKDDMRYHIRNIEPSSKCFVKFPNNESLILSEREGVVRKYLGQGHYLVEINKTHQRVIVSWTQISTTSFAAVRPSINSPNSIS